MKYPPAIICFADLLDTIEAYGGTLDKPRNSKHKVFPGHLPNGTKFSVSCSHSHTKEVGAGLRNQWIRQSKIPKSKFWETYRTKVKKTKDL